MSVTLHGQLALSALKMCLKHLFTAPLTETNLCDSEKCRVPNAEPWINAAAKDLCCWAKSIKVKFYFCAGAP